MADADYRDEDILITDDGRVEFTPEGRAFHTAYFGYAGIDIRTIKTEEDLKRAGRAAFPYLFAFMAQRLRKRRQTLETRALLAIIEGDDEAADRTYRQLLTRERLTVLNGPSGEPPTRP
jgi:hypothetical protein